MLLQVLAARTDGPLDRHLLSVPIVVIDENHQRRGLEAVSRCRRASSLGKPSDAAKEPRQPSIRLEDTGDPLPNRELGRGARPVAGLRRSRERKFVQPRFQAVESAFREPRNWVSCSQQSCIRSSSPWDDARGIPGREAKVTFWREK